MAGVDQVTYTQNSSQSGFAYAGDTITVDESNADTVQQDIDNGCTESVDSSTQEYIDNLTGSGSDEVDYNSESSEEDDGASGGTSASGLMFGPPLFAAASSLVPIMKARRAPSVGNIDLLLGTVAAAAAMTFDGQFDDRVASYEDAEENMDSMNEQLDELSTDVESLADTQEEATSDSDTEAASEVTAEAAEVEEEQSEAETASDEAEENAEVLQEGTQLGAMGNMNTQALMGGAQVSMRLSQRAHKGSFFHPRRAALGDRLCKEAAALFGIAAQTMGFRAEQETMFGQFGRILFGVLGGFNQQLQKIGSMNTIFGFNMVKAVKANAVNTAMSVAEMTGLTSSSSSSSGTTSSSS